MTDKKQKQVDAEWRAREEEKATALCNAALQFARTDRQKLEIMGEVEDPPARGER